MENINLIFDKAPSALYSLWKAFQSRNSSYSPDVEYPIIHSLRTGMAINKSHLKAFYEICDINHSSKDMHILYPFTLAYPYILRVIERQEMPVSMFKILNTRNSITMYRSIGSEEILGIDCYNCAPRLVPKGLEIDIKSIVSSEGEKIWENITTYFCPGKFSSADATYSAPKLDAINDAPTIKEWYFPAKDRFRFARISGDSNGIHYGSFYARLMGFKRDFAQPIRIVAKCVSLLPQNSLHINGWLEDVVANCSESLSSTRTTGLLRLDFHLKGPVYYESNLTLKNIQTKDGSRFDLYCSGNRKPVVSGILYKI